MQSDDEIISNFICWHRDVQSGAIFDEFANECTAKCGATFPADPYTDQLTGYHDNEGNPIYEQKPEAQCNAGCMVEILGADCADCTEQQAAMMDALENNVDLLEFWSWKESWEDKSMYPDVYGTASDYFRERCENGVGA